MADESPLSEREADIMRQVVTGASNREIARVLEISPNTVKVHLRNIFDKLGVASRTEATLVVLREGWVEVKGVGVEAELVPAVEASPPSPENGSPTEIIIPARPSRMPSSLIVGLGAVVLLLFAILGVLLFRPDTPSPTTLEAEPSRWRQLAQLPAPRADALSTTLGRTLLVVGGEGAEGLTGELWRYELSTGHWEPRAAMPVPVRSAGIAMLGGDLFVVGGIGADGRARALLQRYDLERDEWSEARLPSPLARGPVAAFEGELFLFGGWDGSDLQDTIYRYRPNQEEWESIAHLPTPRADLAAVAVGDGIVLIGGMDEAGDALDEVLHFDPRRSNPLRAEAPLPNAEARPLLVALGSALYLLGEGGFFERDPEQQWHQLPLPDTSLPPRAALVASDPYVVVVGGEQAGEALATVWQYQALYRTFVPVVPGGP